MATSSLVTAAQMRKQLETRRGFGCELSVFRRIRVWIPFYAMMMNALIMLCAPGKDLVVFQLWRIRGPMRRKCQQAVRTKLAEGCHDDAHCPFRVRSVPTNNRSVAPNSLNKENRCS